MDVTTDIHLHLAALLDRWLHFTSLHCALCKHVKVALLKLPAGTAAWITAAYAVRFVVLSGAAAWVGVGQLLRTSSYLIVSAVFAFRARVGLADGERAGD